MQDLQTFTFEDGITLTTLERNGQAWFMAADVCRALGIHPTATRRLDDDEKGLHTTQTLGGRQEVAIINESGLYSLIFTSRKEQAKRFKRWVTGGVLPTLRKHGGYIVGMEALDQKERETTLQVIQKEVKRVGLCHIEEKEARSEALRFMRR